MVHEPAGKTTRHVLTRELFLSTHSRGCVTTSLRVYIYIYIIPTTIRARGTSFPSPWALSGPARVSGSEERAYVCVYALTGWREGEIACGASEETAWRFTFARRDNNWWWANAMREWERGPVIIQLLHEWFNIVSLIRGRWGVYRASRGSFGTRWG